MCITAMIITKFVISQIVDFKHYHIFTRWSLYHINCFVETVSEQILTKTKVIMAFKAVIQMRCRCSKMACTLIHCLTFHLKYILFITLYFLGIYTPSQCQGKGTVFTLKSDKNITARCWDPWVQF